MTRILVHFPNILLGIVAPSRHSFVMHTFRRESLETQVANHLKDRIRAGEIQGELEGEPALAAQLGVSRGVLRAALAMLSGEGWLEEGGQGRPRKVANRSQSPMEGSLRIGLLLELPLNEEVAFIQYLYLSIMQELERAGHVYAVITCSTSPKSKRLDRKRIRKKIDTTQVDAWIVGSVDRDMLEWLSERPEPVLALGGRCEGLSVACCYADLTAPMCETVDALVNAGHTRCVMIAANWRRKPKPGPTPAAFIRRMTERAGDVSLSFHLPEWDDTPEGLERILESLFRVTPPTAIITLDPSHCVAVLMFLGNRGLSVPRDVSVICTCPDPYLAFSSTKLSYFDWPLDQQVKHTLKWIGEVSRGQQTRGIKVLHARLIRGGGIGLRKRSATA
ncbi:MAG: substrate-binding domain-containing protein [Akkermansiaceae bacterium]|nr:substrate-binding domain-containing protein [Akkermansiaceae bacterium]